MTTFSTCDLSDTFSNCLEFSVIVTEKGKNSVKLPNVQTFQNCDFVVIQCHELVDNIMFSLFFHDYLNYYINEPPYEISLQMEF